MKVQAWYTPCNPVDVFDWRPGTPPQPQEGELTDEHATSSYGQPVLILGGVPHGPGDVDPFDVHIAAAADDSAAQHLYWRWLGERHCPHWWAAGSIANPGPLGEDCY